ncbi:GNAT family N-acetyltransferase [Sphingomonas donggukensis]|uniref:GNAT family N-acetyltransferase n=1 Tax=Sphingomonas donggukensis TaxID=2949093 RepID=A0ABY4TYI1_9SPHN|nr:GNAT family N-acetyltransferase [Sphingomonas donggukensis]URW76711.1 GNAT family N-acetyltransferase [Sphingomonas donggukensis]
MTLAIRPATLADVPAIVALMADDVNGARREDASLPIDPAYEAAFAAIDADPNQELIVAEQGDRIVGTVQISFLPGLAFRGALRGQIESVRIASDLRGHGLGRQLIEWAVARCRQRGCKFVQLTSQSDRTAAHRFYTRLGWDQSHLGFKLHFGDLR